MVRFAILHEGSDKDNTDRKFIKSLLADLSIDENLIYFDGFGSKTNFFDVNNQKYKKLQQFISAGQIQKILFIIDADDEKDDTKYKGYANTQAQLQTTINQLGFEAISSVYIVCNPETQTGYLESLILATLPEDKRDCIECFVNCSQINPKQLHKTIINNLYSIAYPEPPYNFAHPHFEPLKKQLQNLFQ
ncbi:MAG: DUF3226 domain-containing protein [Methylococcaceae bacterium]